MDHTTPPDLAPRLDDLEALAEAAFAQLPGYVRQAAADVVIRVAEFAPEEMLADMEIDDPFSLTGLYEGVALTERTHDAPPDLPATVWLFRRPILDEWVSRGDVGLAHLVSHVLVHELAHHLGWSDDDIAAVDDWTL
ncbi:MAG: metallopeptidase family protein [Pseudomonadota bacterium]